MAAISRSDEVRISNRSRILSVLREENGSASRARIVARTGLSAATVSAITSDMMSQNLLRQGEEPERAETGKARGRPVTRVALNRSAGFAVLIEFDLQGARVSLVDYSGKLVDRIETRLGEEGFARQSPVDFFLAQVERIRARNADLAGRILRTAISVQGLLNRQRTGLDWSPVRGLAGIELTNGLGQRLKLPVVLHKRGVLLATGIRHLYPQLRKKSVATIFVGSTVAMGISHAGAMTGQGTEFGHMNHIPEGALCRCGQRGCVEAYAADYGVLRTAFGVPETTAPAPAVPQSHYLELIGRARSGDKRALHAFNLAGRALGYGLSRLLTVFDPDHIVIVGPGAEAFGFMQAEFERGLNASVVAKVKGHPQVTTHGDAGEPVFRGLACETLNDIDRTDFAPLPLPEQR